MKGATLSILMALTVSMTAVGDDSKEKPGNVRGKMEGTWKLVSAKYGNMPRFADAPKDPAMLKIFGPTHYIWMMYDSKTGTILQSLGGMYSLHDEVYKESFQFGSGMDLKPYIGTDQIYKVTFDGKRLHQSGTRNGGEKLEEIWERIESTPTLRKSESAKGATS